MKRLLTIFAAGLLTVGLSGGVTAPNEAEATGGSVVFGNVTGNGAIAWRDAAGGRQRDCVHP